MAREGETLSLSEAYTRDVGRGIIRIDHDTLEKLGIESGQYVYVLGRRKTIARCELLWPVDEGRGIVRADGMIRHNANATFGDKVLLVKAQPLVAKHIKFMSSYHKLFSWTTIPDIPHEANMLMRTLRDKYQQKWIKMRSTSIKKSSNGKVITISDGRNSLRLILTKEAKVNIELQNGETYEMRSVPEVNDVIVLGFDPAPNISSDALHEQVDGIGFVAHDNIFVFDSSGERRILGAIEWDPRSECCIVDKTSTIEIVSSESFADLKYPKEVASAPPQRTRVGDDKTGYLVGPELDTDKGQRLVRLEKSKMEQLCIESGDVIRITSRFGSYKTKCYEFYPVNDFTIRMSAELRSKLGIEIGDSVAVEKITGSSIYWLKLIPIFDVVFEWEMIPAFPDQSLKLAAYIKSKFKLDWIDAKRTLVKKLDNNAIIVRTEQRELLIRRQNDVVTLETDEAAVYPMSAKIEQGRLMVFEPLPVIDVDTIRDLIIDQVMNKGEMIPLYYRNRKLLFKVDGIHPPNANLVGPMTNIVISQNSLQAANSGMDVDTD